MITIATAECFTHGILAREIHALAQGYEDNFGSKYSYLVNKVQKDCLKDAIMEDKCSIFDLTDLSVTCGLFIPTLDAVKSILQIENPVEPLELVKGIKVYDDDGDIEMSILMAEAAKKIANASIGIGTTAGIGYGGIAIVDDDVVISTSSDVSANLIDADSNNLYMRQKSGIEKTLKILIYYLNENFDKIKSLENVNIHYK
ncbi:FeGP cofactor biosynthesis protein HcgF family protein [Methanobrevibacter sp.]|uniref:FeGP cofactor biosynthesis protein HcgF family protein n=1 Tax=Methanobrevibacter sp. TaxID=66852 RepID=UPI0038677AB2